MGQSATFESWANFVPTFQASLNVAVIAAKGPLPPPTKQVSALLPNIYFSLFPWCSVDPHTARTQLVCFMKFSVQTMQGGVIRKNRVFNHAGFNLATVILASPRGLQIDGKLVPPKECRKASYVFLHCDGGRSARI